MVFKTSSDMVVEMRRHEQETGHRIEMSRWGAFCFECGWSCAPVSNIIPIESEDIEFMNWSKVVLARLMQAYGIPSKLVGVQRNERR